jgi:hypothetical protein
MDCDNTGTIDRRKFLMYLDQLEGSAEKKDTKSDVESESSDALSVTSESSVSSFEETDSRSQDVLSSEHGQSSHHDSQMPEPSPVETERISADEGDASVSGDDTSVSGDEASVSGDDADEKSVEDTELDYRDLLVKQLQVRDHEFVLLAEYVSILKRLGSKVTVLSPLLSHSSLPSVRIGTLEIILLDSFSDWIWLKATRDMSTERSSFVFSTPMNRRKLS